MLNPFAILTGTAYLARAYSTAILDEADIVKNLPAILGDVKTGLVTLGLSTMAAQLEKAAAQLTNNAEPVVVG